MEIKEEVFLSVNNNCANRVKETIIMEYKKPMAKIDYGHK